MYNVQDDVVNDGVDELERQLRRLVRAPEAKGDQRRGGGVASAGVDSAALAEIVKVRRRDRARTRRGASAAVRPTNVYVGHAS